MPHVKVKPGHVVEELDPKTKQLIQYTAGQELEITEQRWRELKGIGAIKLIEKAAQQPADVSGTLEAVTDAAHSAQATTLADADPVHPSTPGKTRKAPGDSAV